MTHPKQILNELGLHPLKRFGQHFLVSSRQAEALIAAAGIKPGDAVIEIGPGLGALTERVLDCGASVLAVEKDRKLAAYLGERFAPARARCSVIQADFLEFSIPKAPARKKWICMGNLPYYITSPILFHLLDATDRLSHAVLTMQREVVRRIIAEAGCRDYGRLSLAVRMRAEARGLLTIRAGSFFPEPDVESRAIHLAFREKPLLRAGLLPEQFLRVVKVAFGARRKSLAGALLQGSEAFSKDAVTRALNTSGLDGRRRAETLSYDEFQLLSTHLYVR